jgi:tetratricopeptide (TPR) repeat protein
LPSDHREWNALAWTYLQSGQNELALDAARRAHEASRGNLDYLNTLGVAYGEMGELALAESSFRKALKRKPVFLEALVNLGKTLEKQERFADSLPLYERALALDQAYPKLATSLARLYRQRGDAARARNLLDRLARHIEGQDLALALADCDYELAGIGASIDRLSAAVHEHPDWILARNALAHASLADGRWRTGWQEYLSRHALYQSAASVATALPASLAGERILLRGEQGLGDVLFFLRFAPLLKARGAKIGLVCAKKLHGILGDALEDVMETPAPGFDRELWLGDLPALLRCEETPPAWPLAVKSEARERLAALGQGPYLAVTWRAGTDTARGREFGTERTSLTKAVPASDLGAALRGWKGTVVLLQRGARVGEAAQFADALGAACHDLSFLGDDLPMLTALLGEIDEYVTVSNTNVHLVAGLRRRARVLVPYPAEWRWMRRDGESPWFPGFPVYRQALSRDWSAALKRLREDLRLV